MTYETLKIDSDYEILNEYPYTIRRKDNHFEPTESYNNDGYIQVHLNSNTYGKHVVIATQWIENDDPEHKTQVDHRNKHRDDNHIENLRWVTPSRNLENRSSSKGIEYEYVDELPIDVVPIILYKGIEYDGYFIDQDGDVWFDNGVQFRKLYIDKKNTIKMRDIYNKSHHLGIKGLIHEFL